MTGPLGVASEGEPIEIKQQITTFVEDGDVSSSDINTTKMMPTASDARDVNVNAVVDFLSRPITLANFDWLTGDAIMTELFVVDLPIKWINQPMILEKLQGFRYLKCDFIVKVQVNSQPFNAGRLLMWYEPVKNQLAYRPSSVTHFGGITGYPKVELDLSSDTAMELRVPFHNVISHFDMARGDGTMGQVHVCVYSALTGVTDVDATVWVWADNIDLQLPTGAPFVNGQMGLKAERRRPGNVETLSNAVGSVARTLSGVPIIGSLSGPVSFITDVVSGVASIFGWSKPQDPEFPVKMEPGYGKYLGNFNGDVKGKSLALDVRNEIVTPTEVFNTEEDEMSFSHIFSKPIYLQRFTMSKQDAYQKELFRIPCVPTAVSGSEMSFTDTSGGTVEGVVMNNTYLSYFSQLFRFWRGGLKYTFKVIKTPFHSGRIRVFVIPGLQETDNFDPEKSYSKIYDLRETNEFEVEVPYKYHMPWHLVRRPDEHYNAPSAIVVQVLNSLRNPATCSDYIEFIVEISGMDDFQLAYPVMSGREWILSNAPAEALVNAQSSEIIQAKSTGKYAANVIGIGEVVTSTRQLLKRYEFISDKGTEDYNFITPYLPTTGTLLTKTFDDAGKIQRQDPTFYDWVSAIFRFQAGSMRISSVLLNHDEPLLPKYSSRNYYFSLYNPLLFPNSELLTPTGHLPGSVRGFRSLGPFAIQMIPNEPLVELDVPFYQPSSAILTSVGGPENSTSQALANQQYDKLPHNPGSALYILNDDGTPLPRSLFSLNRSIGEDFSFGFMLGVPLTLYVTAESYPI